MFDTNTSGEYTKSEVRDQYLRHIAQLCKHWETESRAVSTKEKLEGLAFSILSMLDGSTMLPGCMIIPMSTTYDVEFYQENGSRWYAITPENKEFEQLDIGGSLHEQFFSYTEPQE